MISPTWEFMLLPQVIGVLGSKTFNKWNEKPDFDGWLSMLNEFACQGWEVVTDISLYQANKPADGIPVLLLKRLIPAPVSP